MKTLRNLLLATLLSLPVMLTAGAKEEAAGSSAGNHVFVLKPEKKFVGAKVEIFAASGQLITSQTVDKKKLVIDFGDVQNGLYTIRLTNGNDVEEYTFEKK